LLVRERIQSLLTSSPTIIGLPPAVRIHSTLRTSRSSRENPAHPRLGTHWPCAGTLNHLIATDGHSLHGWGDGVRTAAQPGGLQEISRGLQRYPRKTDLKSCTLKGGRNGWNSTWFVAPLQGAMSLPPVPGVSMNAFEILIHGWNNKKRGGQGNNRGVGNIRRHSGRGAHNIRIMCIM
jgi:hypothetical protein